MHVEQTTIDRICCQFWKMRWSILHISTKLNFVVWDDSNTKQMQLWEPFSKNKWKNWIQLIFWPAIYSPFFFFKNKLWIRILQSIENSFLSRYGLGKINLNAPWSQKNWYKWKISRESHKISKFENFWCEFYANVHINIFLNGMQIDFELIRFSSHLSLPPGRFFIIFACAFALNSVGGDS